MFEKTSEKHLLVTELKKVYAKLRRRQGKYELYNLMEKCLMEIKLTANE